MKKFILKLTILFLCITLLITGCIYATFNLFAPQYSQGYNASIIDKINRLNSIEEPKIILVGNSNLSFGINSEMIEKEFDMPVVNLGLHGGLGNAFHENMAKFNIKKDDIVIICHSSYSTDKISDYTLAWTTIENNYELWKLIDKCEYTEMLKALPNYIIKTSKLYITGKGNSDRNDQYSRKSFNKYGDISYPRKKRTYTFNQNSSDVPDDISDKAVKRINEFNSYCKGKGASLLIAGYPIAYGEYTPDKSKFITFQKNLEETLDCAIISDFTDYFIKYDYFFDTKLHLTDDGAKIRTQQLINDIKNWKKNTRGAASIER